MWVLLATLVTCLAATWDSRITRASVGSASNTSSSNSYEEHNWIVYSICDVLMNSLTLSFVNSYFVPFLHRSVVTKQNILLTIVQFWNFFKKWDDIFEWNCWMLQVSMMRDNDSFMTGMNSTLQTYMLSQQVGMFHPLTCCRPVRSLLWNRIKCLIIVALNSSSGSGCLVNAGHFPFGNLGFIDFWVGCVFPKAT